MKRHVAMRAALADPALLGNALVGESWSVWRIFLIASMGERLTAEERRVFQKFTRRKREPGERIEEALYLIGRRGGKDRAAAPLAAYLAALVDWSGVLARGEKGLVLCIGADQRQAKITRDYIEGVFDASPMMSGLVVNRTADTIELSNGITIEVRAANFRRLRGSTCVAVIATEAAFWFDDTSANSDAEILTAVRPALATTGGPLIIITTPYAQRGEVWNIYRQHFGSDGDPLVLVAQGTSRDFNPTLSQKVIDRATERDPAAAAAEYGAVFRTDVELIFGREAIEACVSRGVRERPPVAGVSYVGFVDPSGGSADAMTMAIAHAERDVAVLDCMRARRPPFSPDAVVAEFAALLQSYGILKVKGDRYAGAWPVEAFAKQGIQYEAADNAKSEIYGALLPAINSRRCDLLDDARLLAELAGLERHVGRGGRDSIDHRPGAHDDVANAAAGAIVLALGRQPFVITPELLQRVAAMPSRRHDGLFGARRRSMFMQQPNFVLPHQSGENRQ